MDHPNSAVTWEVDAASLSAGRSKVLRSAVATAEHCLKLWSDFLAATSHPLRIVVTVADDAEPVLAVRLVGAQEHLGQSSFTRTPTGGRSLRHEWFRGFRAHGTALSTAPPQQYATVARRFTPGTVTPAEAILASYRRAAA